MGEVPLDARLRTGMGPGVPLMAGDPDSPLGEVFRHVAEAVAGQVSIAAVGAGEGKLPFKPGPGLVPLK
jgi:hypothetical protein